MDPVTIAVTGAGGQIAYSLLFRLAGGELFGPRQPICLHLLDLPEALSSLEGVRMELEDCAFPLLAQVRVFSHEEEAFQGIDCAFLLGSKPRGPGMERKDLLLENGKIFAPQGRALSSVANKGVKVLVVGNPCNTNCLIAMHHAPSIPRRQFHAMTRLDQHRLSAQLARRAQVPVGSVSNAIIWGNHSATQVPDSFHATMNGKSAVDVIGDLEFLKGPLIEEVQKRGAKVIAQRGKSSAASAAHAALLSMRSFLFPTKEWFSMAIDTKDNPYGIQEDLVFSFPCREGKEGGWEIVPDLSIDLFLAEKIKMSEKELMEEREMVSHLLKGR